MVRITNGSNIFEVTSGAFESVFKPQGYHIVEDEKPVEAVKTVEAKAEVLEEDIVEEVPEEEVETEEDDFVELLEKPLSQWTKAEVKDFALAKGIDTKAAKNVSEAKNIIKEYIDKLSQEN